MIRADGGDLLRLRAGVFSAVAADGGFHLLAWPHAGSFGRLAPELRATVRRLAAGPCLRRELGGGSDLDRLVDGLLTGGWLEVTVCDALRRPVYTVQPIGPPEPPLGVPAGARLSRFAVLRRDGGDMVLESPRAWCRVRVRDPHLLAVLAAPESGRDELADRLRHDMAVTGFLVSTEDTQDPEETELRLAQWTAPELWFHASSRPGHHAAGAVGATFWARDRFDPVPERSAPFAGPSVALRRPDLAAVRRKDPPLTEVLEERRSVREHNDGAPLSVDELAEFLYRCAGARERHDATAARPYPAGGGLYELELYPVVRLVAGLDAGLYHYDPHGHRLIRVPGPHAAAHRLLTAASWSTATSGPPQVLIVISARFGRVMWKYRHMGYAIVLKDVGVLMQTMYAVATAMGLAPCAIGSGDSDAFAEATGLDRFAESSVGEFMLGSRG